MFTRCGRAERITRKKLTRSKKKDSRYAAAVFAIFVTEALLEFAVFHAKHENSGDDGKYGKGEAHRQAGTDAPSHEFAEVRQINRVTHAGANAGGDQALLMTRRFEFRAASQLFSAEASAAGAIKQDAASEQCDRRNPREWRAIQLDVTPGPGDCAQDDPHQQPKRN